MAIFKKVKFKALFSKVYLDSIFIIVLLGIILRTFQQLPSTFFQQDEWLGYGQLLVMGWGNIFSGNNNIITIFFGDGRPLTRIWGTIFYELFSYSAPAFAIYSILCHGINTILVYWIIKKLMRNKFFAFLGACYFAVADVAHQSVSWFGASFGEQPAAIGIFLSVLLFLFFLGKKKKIYLYVGFLSAAISLYFKENGIFLFPFFLIIPFIYDKKNSFKKIFILYLPFLIFIVIFIGYRLIEMLFVRTPSSGDVYTTASSMFIFPTLAIRAILYPLTSFSLIFTPYPIALSLGEWLWKLYYPYLTQRPDFVFTTAILDLIAVIFSGTLLVWNYILAKKKTFTWPISFSLLFFFLSLMPYVVVSKTFAYLEPRYYYISLLSAGIIIACSFSYLYSLLKGRWKFLFVLLLVFYAIYIRYNIGVVRRDIAVQVDIANERKAFISRLYTLLPTLKSNTNVFYFTGNKSWLVDNNFTPFQNGFGHTFMILYYKSGKIPPTLLQGEYLWRLDDEGFKSINGLTFGYYSVLSDLEKSVKENNISLNNIHAYYYDRDTKKLTDITVQIRARLERDTSTSSL